MATKRVKRGKEEMAEDFRLTLNLAADEKKAISKGMTALVELALYEGDYIEVENVTKALEHCAHLADWDTIIENRMSRMKPEWDEYDNDEFMSFSLERCIDDIYPIQTMPGGSSVAMHLVLKVTKRYLQAITPELVKYEDGSDIPVDFRSTSQLMATLIRDKYRESQASKEVWDPSTIRGEIKAVASTAHANGDFNGPPFDEGDTDGLFGVPLLLLYTDAARHAATILAEKVAGHRLPLELVLIIRDFTCDEKPLIESPERNHVV